MADKYNINDNETLTRTTEYRVVTDSSTLRIKVHEIIQGDAPHRFYAIPEHPLPLSTVPERFYGKAETEDEALRMCLDNVKGQSKDDIFPKSKSGTENTNVI